MIAHMVAEIAMHEDQALRVANEYIESWNSHDASRALGLLPPGGTYFSPVTGEASREQLARHMSDMFSAFPDLRFELLDWRVSGLGSLVGEWTMRGTHSAPFCGLPPTGKKIALPGVDIIESRGGTLQSIRSYFDEGTLFKQLDALVSVTPKTLGPFRFGEATYTSVGNKNKPGVIGITQVKLCAPEQSERLRQHTIAIIQTISRMPGYISTSTALTWDGYGVTLTAWEDMTSAKRAVQSEPHRAAMRALHDEGLGESIWTSFWTEGQLNVRWQRCRACERISAVSAGLHCKCGETLSEPPWL